MSETADTQAHLDIRNTADDRIAQLDRILEAILLASEQPLPTEQLQRMLGHDLGVTKKDIRDALERLNADLAPRAAELAEVSSGWRIQVKREYAEWVGKLYQEKPPRLSRALLETLALICYRQPITRGEIEDVRGVAMSPNIIRTLLDRGWIREVGVKEVPGRPSLFGTTHQLLDDLNLRTLDDLPSLPEIKDPQQLETALARLGEQLHEVPVLEGALEEEPGDDGETPSAAAALADDAPVSEAGEGEDPASSAAPADDVAAPTEPAADTDDETDGDEPDAPATR
ncbi:MAG: SMC-Scp complex subunit ScpB [Solimonas sp.]